MLWISKDPIFLKIFSPYVPDLSLVDLPGLTMTALTDQGQPKDIREQIQSMLAHYAASERSIILAVVPARQDLEADMALHYVRGDIPRAIKLKYGYFLVKNRSTSEVKRGINV